MNKYILRLSEAVSGWAGWALAHSEFGSSVNPITTRGADYDHHITASPPGFEIPAASLNFVISLVPYLVICKSIFIRTSANFVQKFIILVSKKGLNTWEIGKLTSQTHTTSSLPNPQHIFIKTMSNICWKHGILWKPFGIHSRGIKLVRIGLNKFENCPHILGSEFTMNLTNSPDLTANIFESGPMPTPWKFLAGLPLLPSCKLG